MCTSANIHYRIAGNFMGSKLGSLAIGIETAKLKAANIFAQNA